MSDGNWSSATPKCEGETILKMQAFRPWNDSEIFDSIESRKSPMELLRISISADD